MIPWKLLSAAAAGAALGLGLFVFRISEAPSYLSDNPETCINCHIMRPQFATWRASSHAKVATCNDCHVPHDNVVRKYLFKAADGMRHAAIFTLHLEPEVIRIKSAGASVVQENCIRCHGQLVDSTAMGKLSFTNQANPRPASASPMFPGNQKPMPANAYHADPTRACVDCHRETPHGRVDSLSSAPNTRAPRLKSL